MLLAPIEAQICSMHALCVIHVSYTDTKGCHDVLRQDCVMPALQCAGALQLIIPSKQLYALSTNMVQ